MISGKDLEGWITSGDPLAAMEKALSQTQHRDRRERIATVCMAALLTKYGVGPEDEKHSAYAVAFADALIAELDKPKEVQP